MPAVAQDGAGVAELEDFLHAVRDIEDHAALVPQVADDGEELVDLARGEAAGGFVEGDDLGAAAERLGDFHHLPLADRQVRELQVRVDVLAEAAQLGGGLRVQLRAVDEAAAGGQVAEVDVFRDGHLGDEVQLLVDDRDAGRHGVGGGLENIRRAADPEPAGGGGVGAAESLEQGGLARAVLPHERVNRAEAHAETDPGERRDARVRLGDVLELQVRRGRSHGGDQGRMPSRLSTASKFSRVISMPSERVSSGGMVPSLIHL